MSHPITKPNKSDLFGQAVYDKYLGQHEIFYFKLRGQVFPLPLDRYLRSTKKLNRNELELISHTYGQILDVGCGTGNYIPKLEKHGKVIGIDISEKIIDTAKLMGRKNCLVADIFTYEPKIKFDTITMFENNLGMAGSIEKTKLLFEKLKKLLTDGGQILIILSRRSGKLDYLINNLTPIYKDVEGRSFSWVNYNKNYLEKLCKQSNLDMKVISANKYYYSVRITKINI